MKKLRPCALTSQGAVTGTSQLDCRIRAPSTRPRSHRGVLLVYCNCRYPAEKEKYPLFLCWVSFHWPVCSRKTCFLAERLSFIVSKVMPEKYQVSKRQSIFKPTTPSWLEGSSSARFPSRPLFSWHCLQKSGSEGRVQGGFCEHEQLLDRHAGWSASQEIISAASTFPLCQVQGAEERHLSLDPPPLVFKDPGAGVGWGLGYSLLPHPHPSVNPLTLSTPGPQ